MTKDSQIRVRTTRKKANEVRIISEMLGCTQSSILRDALQAHLQHLELQLSPEERAELQDRLDDAG